VPKGALASIMPCTFLATLHINRINLSNSFVAKMHSQMRPEWVERTQRLWNNSFAEPSSRLRENFAQAFRKLVHDDKTGYINDDKLASLPDAYRMPQIGRLNSIRFGQFARNCQLFSAKRLKGTTWRLRTRTASGDRGNGECLPKGSGTHYGREANTAISGPITPSLDVF